MKTISRAATRQIAAIKTKKLTCHVYSLSHNFIPQDCDPEVAWGELDTYRFARLWVSSDGDVWTVRVHGNLWYELREAPE